MASKKQTPAERARARRDPAIFQLPTPPTGSRTSAIKSMSLRISGRTYPIGPSIEGETPWSEGMDQTGLVTVAVRDPSDWIPRIIDDESMLLQGGVTVIINGIIYVVAGLDHDGEGLYTFTLADEVSERLKLFSKYRSASRARTTRYGFIYSLVEEASRKPYPKMRVYIPEIDDKQPITKAKPTT